MRQQRQPKPLVLAGTLEARTVNVGSLVGGRVVRVLVDEGHQVAAGQTLVTLETETIDRQLDEQRAAIETARAQLAKALAGPRDEEIRKAAAISANDERERRRIQALYSAGIVARQMADDASTKAKASSEDLRALREGTRQEDIAAARAGVAQQERRLASMMKQREETVVRSTVSGTVQSFGLRPGDIVAPNQTVAEILEPRELWVRVYVPETLLHLVRLGMPVTVRIDAGAEFRGRVSTIASEGEYTPRNVQTRAQRAEQVYGVKVIVDPDPRLKPGMAAEVDLGVKANAE
ncbi:MAG TPA: efflux RND transporter periplasmic adaptor subunit [Thermoanaerobaculia bacterium]|nr:efflux RND transporter periplasmic adaptor subunit [Thermoanaerobaculia bacterium]